jgi:hypothetical protein
VDLYQGVLGKKQALSVKGTLKLYFKMYLRVTGVSYVFFHCEQRKVQEYVYCFLIKGCAVNCEGLKTEQSTRYCMYTVICQWLLCSYIRGLISQNVCNINKLCLLIMFTVKMFLSRINALLS